MGMTLSPHNRSAEERHLNHPEKKGVFLWVMKQEQ
jgi:hypothetical protein